MYAARPSALELRGIPTDEPDRDERPAEMHPIVKVAASPRHPTVKVSASPRRSLEGRPVAYAGCGNFFPSAAPTGLNLVPSVCLASLQSRPPQGRLARLDIILHDEQHGQQHRRHSTARARG